jgi:hypothetical protein
MNIHVRNGRAFLNFSKLLLSLLFVVGASLKGFSQGEVPVNMYTGQPGVGVPLWEVSDGDVSVPVSLVYDVNGRQAESLYGQGWNLEAGGSITRNLRGLPDDYQNTSGATRRGWLYNNAQSLSIAAMMGNFAINSDNTASQTTNEAAENTSIRVDWNYQYDTEPDIFHYSFPGFSGSFVFDNSLTIRTIPYADIKIEPTHVSSTDRKITKFKITNNQGYIYWFEAVCVASKYTNAPFLPSIHFLTTEYELYKTTVQYNAEWKLTKIESPSGAYVTFVYANELPIDDFTRDVNVGIYQDLQPNTTGATDLVVRKLYTVRETFAKKKLSEIVSPSGPKMTFTKTAIEIRDTRKGPTNNENFVKGFVLTYKSVPYRTDINGDILYSRDYLMTVTEQNGCTKMPPNKFRYRGVDEDTEYFPHSSYGIDFWGNPNGNSSNTGLIPKIYIYPNEPEKERYRLTPIPGYAGTQIVLNGASRQPSLGSTLQGSLLTVEHPEGGQTTLIFELNDYLDTHTNESLKAGGLRLKSVTYSDGINPEPIVKNFEYLDALGKSSGRIISKPVFAMPAFKWRRPYAPYSTNSYDFLAYSASASDEVNYKFLTVRTETDMSQGETTHGNTVGYQVVTVKRPGSGSVKFEYLQPATFGEVSSGSWSATSNKIIRQNTSADMGILPVSGPFSYPHSPNPPYDYARGLLWKKSEFSETGKLVRLTTNTYQDLFASGFVHSSVWGIRYDKYALSDDNAPTNVIYLAGKYFLIADATKVLASETVVDYDVLETLSTKFVTQSTEYIYSTPNPRMLSEVKTTAADGKIYRTRIKYAKDYPYSTPAAENAVLCVKNLVNTFRHTTPIEQISTVQIGAGPERVTSGSVVKFDFFSIFKTVPESRWLLKTKKPIHIDSFQMSTIQLESSVYKFKIDSRYEKEIGYLSYTTDTKPTSARNFVSRANATTGYSSSLKLPVVQFTNAAEAQSAFSDFENSTGMEFSAPTYYYGTGRSGANAFYPGYKLSKTVTKAAVKNYLLSFWIKSNASLTFYYAVKTGAITNHSGNFSVTSSGGTGFKYVQQMIPVNNAGASFSLELWTTGLTAPPASGSSPGLMPVIDDLFFYPENADATSFSYKIPYGIASATNGNGRGEFRTYDGLGRVTLVANQDNDIVQRNTYSYNGREAIGIVSSFVVKKALDNFTYDFTASDNSCLTDEEYRWDFGSGYVLGTRTASFTYSSIGEKVVKLKVSHSLYGEKETTVKFDVTSHPVEVSMCAKGVQEYSGSTGVVSTYDCAAITLNPLGSTIFKVYYDAINVQFKWQIRNLGTLEWIDLSNTDDEYRSFKIMASTISFEVRCVVTDTSNGNTGATNPMSVIVNP